MGTRVAVAGASGYAGGELLRLIAGHPELELVAAAAHSQAGAQVRSVHPHLVGLGDLTFTAADPTLLAAADLVFLALPHGESAALAAALPPASSRSWTSAPTTGSPTPPPGSVTTAARTPAPGPTACRSCPASGSGSRPRARRQHRLLRGRRPSSRSRR